MTARFCGQCGQARAGAERFCTGCGVAFFGTPALPEPPLSPALAVPTPPSAPMPTPVVVALPAPTVLSARPWWPWLLVASGLILAILLGSQAVTSATVMQRVEASSGVRMASVANWVGSVLLGRQNLGAAVDPRNGPLYVQARERFIQGLVGVGAGVTLTLVGLLTMALWRPSLLPVGAPPPRRNVIAEAAPFLVACAVLWVGAMSLSGLQYAEDAGTLSGAAPPGVSAAVSPPAPALAPVVQQPLPPAAPHPTFYRAAPFGPVKVDPGTTYTVRLGHLAAGTRVSAVVSVQFNSRFSNLTGTPDINVGVTGPCRAAGSWPGVRNGAQIAFATTASGDCAIVLDNTHASVNAKQVSLQFLGQ